MSYTKQEEYLHLREKYSQMSMLQLSINILKDSFKILAVSLVNQIHHFPYMSVYLLYSKKEIRNYHVVKQEFVELVQLPEIARVTQWTHVDNAFVGHIHPPMPQHLAPRHTPAGPAHVTPEKSADNDNKP